MKINCYCRHGRIWNETIKKADHGVGKLSKKKKKNGLRTMKITGEQWSQKLRKL